MEEVCLHGNLEFKVAEVITLEVPRVRVGMGKRSRGCLDNRNTLCRSTLCRSVDARLTAFSKKADVRSPLCTGGGGGER